MHGDPGYSRWLHSQDMANPPPLSVLHLGTVVVC